MQQRRRVLGKVERLEESTATDSSAHSSVRHALKNSVQSRDKYTCVFVCVCMHITPYTKD